MKCQGVKYKKTLAPGVHKWNRILICLYSRVCGPAGFSLVKKLNYYFHRIAIIYSRVFFIISPLWNLNQVPFVLAQKYLRISSIIEKGLPEKENMVNFFFISDFMHFGDKEIRGHTEKIMNCFM